MRQISYILAPDLFAKAVLCASYTDAWPARSADHLPTHSAQAQDAMLAAAEQDAAAAAAARSRADALLADAEVAAAERLLRAAEIEHASALAVQAAAAAAAGADGERTESGKAAALAAAGGILAAAPLLVATAPASPLQAVLSLASAVASCALFGVTYRYAVREDGANTQLRGGVVAAFALVRAAGAADVLQASAAPGDVLSAVVVGSAALYAAQCMLLFGFSAAALEAGFANGLLRRMSSSGPGAARDSNLT